MECEDENMPLNRLNSSDSPGLSCNVVKHVVNCPNIGPLNVYVQGERSGKEVAIMTVHDLGCDHTMFLEFVDHPKMVPIRNKTLWIHVDVPGQGFEDPDLPADYQFPTMQQIGEDLVVVLDQLNIKEVVCLGEGAGANILARFAMVHMSRVLGACLLHTTGTTAGFLESIKDKFMTWKLDQTRMNQNAEDYLLLHRFGATKFSKAKDKEDLRNIMASYQESLRKRVNYKNLTKFVEAFLKRTSFTEYLKNLNCPVLLMTGQLSVFNETTRAMHTNLAKVSADKTKVEFVEVAEVANIFEEKPDKLGECLQYFLQGLGMVSSIPMHNVHKMLRNRTMSMEDYDKPLKDRKNSLTLSGGAGSDAENGAPTSGPTSPTSPLAPILQGEMLQPVQ
jgi:pimeloyl-ACP methyl ester carboxylesterase